MEMGKSECARKPNVADLIMHVGQPLLPATSYSAALPLALINCVTQQRNVH